MAHHQHPGHHPEGEGGTHDGEYTMQDALRDAKRILDEQFEDVDQRAAVALARCLYEVHPRDEFMRTHQDAQDIAFGNPPVS